MSEFIKVFCRSPQLITSEEIAGFVREGVYFDSEAEVAVDRVLPDGSWASLLIRYDAERRPIVMWRNVDDHLVSLEVEEVLEELNADVSGEESGDLRSRLQAARAVYAFEVNVDGLSEDASTMLDTLEAYIARKSEGLVYAPGDGVFDADLQRLRLLGR